MTQQWPNDNVNTPWPAYNCIGVCVNIDVRQYDNIYTIIWWSLDEIVRCTNGYNVNYAYAVVYYTLLKKTMPKPAMQNNHIVDFTITHKTQQ